MTPISHTTLFHTHFRPSLQGVPESCYMLASSHMQSRHLKLKGTAHVKTYNIFQNLHIKQRITNNLFYLYVEMLYFYTVGLDKCIFIVNSPPFILLAWQLERLLIWLTFGLLCVSFRQSLLFSLAPAFATLSWASLRGLPPLPPKSGIL